MKTFNPKAGRGNIIPLLLVTLASLFAANRSMAQPPDCVSGTVAYAVFNDSIGSTGGGVLDSLEIRPVNLLTGTVGNLIGNRRYWVRKLISGTYYYGSSALAVDFASSKFYVMTQMSSAGPKDIVCIDPVLGTTTVIGTTPSSLDGYHFVKMTSHATNGWIYAIGVHRDSTNSAATVNPVIRFPVCGTAGCATANIQILGYLPGTGITYKWKLFNGDIAFDASGNLFFATAAFETVGGNGRYTDARLFRINFADLPTSAGAGTIPMTLIADYDVLDSTVINGIAFNSAGTMFFTTRKYSGPQNTPLPPFASQLYRSSFPGSATQMTSFVRPTAGTSVSDLATCYYPAAILSNHLISLSGQYTAGTYHLQWEANTSTDNDYYLLQESADGVNFSNASRVEKKDNGNMMQKYHATEDGIGGAQIVYYRVALVTKSGLKVYSNVVKLTGVRMWLTKRIVPNPFISEINLSVQLRNSAIVQLFIRDDSGRLLLDKTYSGNPGENNFRLSGLDNLKPGVYIIELQSGDELIREKLIKG